MRSCRRTRRMWYAQPSACVALLCVRLFTDGAGSRLRTGESVGALFGVKSGVLTFLRRRWRSLSADGAGGVPGLEFDGSALSTADPASITRAGGVRLPTPEGPPLSAAGTALAGDAGGVPISTCSWPG